MKIHAKKKAYQAMCKKLANQGMINDENGRFVPRNQIADTQMRKDYYPQRLA